MFLEIFKSAADVIAEYQAPADALEGAEVLLAWYGYGSYCGDSLVVFRKDGKLYEVNGSHCSCYGLEGCWSPEETTADALAKRDISGEYDGASEANAALKELVSKLQCQS